MMTSSSLTPSKRKRCYDIDDIQVDHKSQRKDSKARLPNSGCSSGSTTTSNVTVSANGENSTASVLLGGSTSTTSNEGASLRTKILKSIADSKRPPGNPKDSRLHSLFSTIDKNTRKENDDVDLQDQKPAAVMGIENATSAALSFSSGNRALPSNQPVFEDDRKMPASSSLKEDVSDDAGSLKEETTTGCRLPRDRQETHAMKPLLSGEVDNATSADSVPPMTDLDAVDGVFRKAAILVGATWLILVTGTYFFLPFDSVPADPVLDKIERRLPQTAFFILLISNILQITPVIMVRVRSASLPLKHQPHPNQQFSGILACAMVISFISMMTNALLGWGPYAVVPDPVSGSRVFLWRWLEWTPLSGFMTLLAESADISVQAHAWRAPLIVALSQSLSTVCGLIFPYCQSTTQWIIVMAFSTLLFLMIFPRVQLRKQLLDNTPKGRTVLEREYYDRRKLAYFLVLMCSICWSVLVALYFFDMTVHMVCGPDSWWRFVTLEMSWHTIADVIAKVVYIKFIVEAHQTVFATDVRTARQLNELKQLMAMLWVSSSDVIVISTKLTENRNATMISPSFVKLVGASPSLSSDISNDNDQLDSSSSCSGSEVRIEDPESKGGMAALVLETDRGKVQAAYYVDTESISGDPYPERIDPNKIKLANEDMQHHAVQQALRITNAAWTARKQSDGEHLRALTVIHCDESRSDGKGKINCEMKVSRHTEQTVIAIVRDVTERYRRFEAESRVHAETLARQRDMHTANRFTRHEVKNGLLSGIEICRVLGDSLSDLKNILQEHKREGKPMANAEGCQDPLEKISSLVDSRAMKSLVDLDGSLRGVLDTVLAEVMAREVVHGVYKPQLEELDIPSMLVSALGMSKERFPITVEGGSMPRLLLDAHLLCHIHRNAVSNAAKYGKQDGFVNTVIAFDKANQQFRMEVTNEPGIEHQRLLAMGESASEFVFAQGVRLQPHIKGTTEKKLDSSGDGAWIMQKCAKTLQGKCSIHFSHELTRFEFRCPAVPVCTNTQPKYTDFVVPDNVWAIGLDDSRIQRKLMSRIFEHVGIDSSRQMLLGESPEDVTEFESTLLNYMEEHPAAKFLIIVDEHLDYDNLANKHHDGVYSGSKIMKEILDRMPKDCLSRCLALMRSANDSAIDISLYTQRTHGYFPKAIMQRDRTRQQLAPLWQERFGSS